MYAHSLGEDKKDWHKLSDHLLGTAERTRAFTAVFDATLWGFCLGVLHDVGKASKFFQLLLEGIKRRVDHSTAGGQLAFELLQNFQEYGVPLAGGALPKGKIEYGASLLAYGLMGHHGGLPDGGYNRMDKGTLFERRYRKVEDYSDWEKLNLPIEIPDSLPKQIEGADPEDEGFAAFLFIRMLFSALVDADRLDTEAFCNPDEHSKRPQSLDISAIHQEFFKFLKTDLNKGTPAKKSLNYYRRKIQDHCITAASQDPGSFSLTVPTGGGKTYSSFAFALEHAKIHQKRRIIYVIPYTSIIDQNAKVFRESLGDLEDSILEHHSAYSQKPSEDDSQLEKNKAEEKVNIHLAEESWDMPVIVTTAVQFFESLFASNPSKCRKVHNIADSVIILDEAQILPLKLLNPCVKVLRELVRGYGVSIVLCTATQPALEKNKKLCQGFTPGELREIVPKDDLDEFFQVFERTEISHVGNLNDDALAKLLNKEDQVLAITNTRLRARELFEKLDKDEGNYHLSALMYPAHRLAIIEEIKNRLKKGLKCRVVSTSLIEAGVDIDFPVVFREETGLDSIAQAAGRCNREAKLDKGKVLIFKPDNPVKDPSFQRRISAFNVIGPKYEDILSPEAVEAYFSTLYNDEESLDGKSIIEELSEANTDSEFDEMVFIPFRQIASDFRFIESNTSSLIVEKNEAIQLISALEKEEDYKEAKKIIRQLQSYTVQVYNNIIPIFHTRKMERYGLIILTEATGYSNEVGLMHDAPDFREVEKNVF